tara:strand:+ start:72 stop:254 length:183 start_codon:yes stop_codon:yes gene_type:complete
VNTNRITISTEIEETTMSDKTIATSIRIPSSLKKKIEKKAAEEGRTLNNMLNRLLEQAVA